MRAAYQTDSVIAKLKDAILNSWLWTLKKLALATLAPYRNVRDELFLKDDLLNKGGQLLIPRLLRREYMKLLHSSHLGAFKCLERAKQYSENRKLSKIIEL